MLMNYFFRGQHIAECDLEKEIAGGEQQKFTCVCNSIREIANRSDLSSVPMSRAAADSRANARGTLRRLPGVCVCA